MRLSPLVLLAACGAPAFVPVTVRTSRDVALSHRVVAEVTKKLNPSCASNCEMGIGIEDGGCSFIDSQGVCTPSGGTGVYLPFQGVQVPDAGELVSPARGIAPGSDFLLRLQPDEPGCQKTFAVPAAALEISIDLVSSGTCSFSTK